MANFLGNETPGVGTLEYRVARLMDKYPGLSLEEAKAMINGVKLLSPEEQAKVNALADHSAEMKQYGPGNADEGAGTSISNTPWKDPLPFEKAPVPGLEEKPSDINNQQRALEARAGAKVGPVAGVTQQEADSYAPIIAKGAAGKTTYTFTDEGLGGFISSLTQDALRNAVNMDPNSNIGANPNRTQAQTDALPQDPMSVMKRNASVTPLSNDVINQLRGAPQTTQQSPLIHPSVLKR